MRCSTACDGAQLVEQVADPVEAGVVEVRVADRVLDLGHRGRRPALRGPLHGEREQQRALALAQVVAGGLAGDRRVAEHAEQVVAQLEGHADVGAEPAVAATPGPGRPRRSRRRGAAAAPRCRRRSCSGRSAARPGPTVAGGLVEARRGTGRRAPRCASPPTGAPRAQRRPRPARRRAACRRPRPGRGRRAGWRPRRRTGPAGRASRRRRAGGRTRRARSAGRGGWRRRPSGRRGSARRPGSAPARRSPRSTAVASRTVRVAARAAPAPPGEGRPDPLAAAQHELAQVARWPRRTAGSMAAAAARRRSRNSASACSRRTGRSSVGGRAGRPPPAARRWGSRARPCAGPGERAGGREDTAPRVSAPSGHGAATRRRHGPGLHR